MVQEMYRGLARRKQLGKLPKNKRDFHEKFIVLNIVNLKLNS
jgi:hypothetical protein